MDNDSDEEIKITNNIDNSIRLKYFPKIKSNFDLISNYNYDVKEILYKGCVYLPNLLCDNNNKIWFYAKQICLSLKYKESNKAITKNSINGLNIIKKIIF